MPELRWRKRNGAILPAGSWKPGKEIVLGSDEFMVSPGHFTIYRRPGAVMRRFRERQGKPALIAVDKLKAYDDADGSMRARSEPWTLPTPGRRIKWRLTFEDDQLHPSPLIHVSRLGTMSPTIGAGVPIPHVPGAEATLGIGIEIVASVDPVVEFSVLTPWGEGDEDLRGFLYDLAADSTNEGEDPEATARDLFAYLAPHLPTEQPDGWEFAMRTPRLELPEGERVATLVELRAPTRASTAFAVQMRTPDEPDDLVSVSDLLVIEVPDDPAQASLLFGDDDGRGELRIKDEFAEPASWITVAAERLRLSPRRKIGF